MSANRTLSSSSAPAKTSKTMTVLKQAYWSMLAEKSIIPFIRQNWADPAVAELRIRLRTMRKPTAVQHPLNGRLIISLTSYPARFQTLHLTLQCLLSQSVRPDRVILWIAYEDMGQLPVKVLALKDEGLEIIPCEDLRSYKKIIPTLELDRAAYIVTADDDLYYWPDWLRELLDLYRPGERTVICHRGHRITQDANGGLLPYSRWQHEIHSPAACADILPTSGAGVLYPPGCFHPQVTDRALFRRLAPQADDLWLYWMIRLNGFSVSTTNSQRALVNWRQSQNEALWTTNGEGGGNDRQISALLGFLGKPL